MQSRSDLWKTYAADGTIPLQTVAVIDGVEYSAVSAPVITAGLASDALSIGNCASATLDLSILTEDTIAKSAEVVIKMRYTDGENPTEWLERGTFYISRRSTDYVTNLVTLQCYDSMLKASVEFPEELLSGTWPKDMETVVEDIAAQIGVEVDARTVINSGDDYTVPYPDGLTMQEVLGYIAAVHGGNFIITPQNQLRLVPLISAPEEDDLADTDAIAVAAVLGTLTLGQTTSVTGISGTDENGNAFSSGTDDGYTITITSNPCFTQAVCDSLLAQLSGVVWRSYEMTQAIYDPAAELGDYITYADGGVRSILWEETATLNIAPRMGASVPSAGDLEDEYPYKSSIEKLTETVVSNSKTIKATGEKVETVEGQITAKVWQTDIESAIGDITVGSRNFVANSDEEKSCVKDYVKYYLTDYGKAVIPGRTIVISYEAKTDTEGNVCDQYIRTDSASNSTGLGAEKYTKTLTTDWERYSQVVEVNDNEDSVMVCIRSNNAVYGCDTTIQASATLYVRNVKVELGNVATDWTPAPEDTEEALTTLETNFNSQLDAAYDAIAAQTVGGRNYALDSGAYTEETDTGVWWCPSSNFGTYHSIVAYDGYLRIQCDADASSSYNIFCSLSEMFDPSETYTVTLYFRPSTAYIPGLRARYADADGTAGNATITANGTAGTAGEWQKVTQTFTPNADCTYSGIGFNLANFKTAGDYIDIGWLMVERGTAFTDWNLAPEDLITTFVSINESYAELVLTMDGITSDVGTINTILAGDDDTTGLADLVNDSATTIDDLVAALSNSDGGYISVESLKSQIEQLPDEVAITISSSLASYEATQEGILTTLDEYATYFSFTTDGLRISDSDSDFALLLASDRVSFLESGSEVAYISDSMLYIYDADILNSLQLGNFKWLPRESGNLSLVKVGDD